MVQQDQELDLRLFRVWMKAYHALLQTSKKTLNVMISDLKTFKFLNYCIVRTASRSKISEILSIPSGSITYVVNKLEKQELVKRQCAPSDKRVFHVLLTDKGKQLFDDIFPKHTDVISQNLSFIETEEKEQLIEWLKKSV